MNITEQENIAFILAQIIYEKSAFLSLKIKEAIAAVLIAQLQKIQGFNQQINWLKKNCNAGASLNKDSEFSSCLRLAMLALHGGFKDSVFKANLFHHQDETPSWSKGQAPILILEPFYFYKIGEVNG